MVARFLAKSAQTHEKNEVAIFACAKNAKMCKRVRKNMKTKDRWLFGWAQGFEDD